MEMKTKTSTGAEVILRPIGSCYRGSPIAAVEIEFVHPDHGLCIAKAKDYDDRRGEPGAIGTIHLGVTGSLHTPSFRYKKFLSSARITIARQDFESVIAVARGIADDAVRREKEMRESEDETNRNDAARGAPADTVLCRKKWSNGDLMSACYLTDDGVEVIASDLIPHHQGWYFVPADVVAEARESDRRESDRKAEAKARRERIDADARAKAAISGDPVEIERWVEDCDGSVDECSSDLCVRVAMPDGSTEVNRTHTY